MAKACSPAAQEVKAGGSLESRSLRPAWVIVRPLSKRKQQKKEKEKKTAILNLKKIYQLCLSSYQLEQTFI
jgi:hypothetical protein